MLGVFGGVIAFGFIWRVRGRAPGDRFALVGNGLRRDQVHASPKGAVVPSARKASRRTRFS
jgi:hypothetical protein